MTDTTAPAPPAPSKPAVFSLGVMGPAIALAVVGANQAFPGLGLTSDDVGATLSCLQEHHGIDLVVGALGLVGGIVGRWRATHRIGGLVSK